ncbi:Hypothetical leucine rich repeat protein [Ectocarpus siliculosus]|uniref:Hypothetical leucine rich repeat protein n=1 Tax=Ectocarpus siliculosus TaxID=2880 RepID=D8LKE3_ECTSI|nr:Hypothetical leucine rich repeat protein [Ectocarpus siliculosus]|eukprot:CBN74533.1 Hypothetical leucine rich repeat protein [Ectocarpus siliculosus]
MGRVREAQHQKGSVASGELLPYYAPMTQMKIPAGTRNRHQAYDVPTTTYAQLAWPPKGTSPEDGAAKLDDRQYGRNHCPPRSMPSAVAMDDDPAPRSPARPGPEESLPTAANPSDVLLVDLGSRSLLQEDLEKALRLWTRPSILIAGRNSLDRLPANVPGTILYLDLSWNRLASLEGFAALPNLRELDVSHNSVQDMLGLVSNVDLRVLRISHNRIRRIEGIHQLKRLEEVDFSHNLLKTKVDVRALSLNAALRRLRIEGNPYCSTGVQHGTYQIALQHLLPGMSLLDGKAPPVLSLSLSSTMPLPPPPRPPAPGKPGDHHRHNSRRMPHRTSRGTPSSCSPDRRGSGSIREGFMASSSLDFVGDLSVERRWRDSAVAGRSQFTPDSHQRAVARGGVRGGVRVRGGGDGNGGRGREPCIKVTTGGGGPTVAPGSYAEIFVAGMRKEGSTSRVGIDDPAAATTSGVSNSSTLAPTQKGAAGAATTQRQQQQPPGHRAAAQRGAARREAWSQARREGAVGDGKMQEQRTSHRQRKVAPGVGGGDIARNRRALGVRSLEPTTRSARRRTPAAAASSRHPRQASGAGGDQAFDTDGSAGGVGGGTSSSSKLGRGGAVNPRISVRSNSGSNARVGRRVGGDSWAKPGATRKPASISNSRSRQTPSTASRGETVTVRGRGGTRSGGGGKTARSALSKDSRAEGSGGGKPNGNARSPSSYRFRTTLGRRGSQQPPRPTAPVASPWTPREDARPWGWGGGKGSDRGGDEDDEDDEIRVVDAIAHDDRVLGYGDGGSGGEGTFVSPLSTAGILHRISSSRRSSAVAAGLSAPPSAAAASSGAVQTGDRPQHQAGAPRNQWQDSEPGVRESGGGGASSAAATEVFRGGASKRKRPRLFSFRRRRRRWERGSSNGRDVPRRSP